MNLPDVSVWLALTVEGHSHRDAAQAWLDGVDEPNAARFCRATQQGLLRLLTTAAVMKPYQSPPLTNSEATGVYDATLSDDRIAFVPAEPAGLDHHWRRFAMRDSPSPKLWMDAYLAAFAIAAGLTMVTVDTGFRQFEGLDLLVLDS